MKRLQVLIVLCLIGLPFSSINAEESLEQRVAGLERKLANQTILDMLDLVDALQREIQELRGLTEEQANELEMLKKRQRELYLDIDRRLSSVEREGPVTVTTLPTDNGGNLTGSPTTEGAAPVDQATANALNNERLAYQAAFNQLRELRYDQAIESFNEFLKQYPSGKYAHIAQYWVGEANYARREFKKAANDYQRLISKFPNSPKAIESKLKIGYCYYELEDYDNSLKQLEKLVEDHPNTTEAGQAQKLIKKIRVSESR